VARDTPRRCAKRHPPLPGRRCRQADRDRRGRLRRSLGRALDSQIFGSVEPRPMDREFYAASAAGIFRVFDDGTRRAAVGGVSSAIDVRRHLLSAASARRNHRRRKWRLVVVAPRHAARTGPASSERRIDAVGTPSDYRCMSRHRVFGQPLGRRAAVSASRRRCWDRPGRERGGRRNRDRHTAGAVAHHHTRPAKIGRSCASRSRRHVSGHGRQILTTLPTTPNHSSVPRAQDGRSSA